MEKVAFRDVTESTKGKTLGALRRYSKWCENMEVIKTVIPRDI